MCLGEILGRITNPGAKKSPQQETPSPVGKESAVSPQPVGQPKVEEKKPKVKTGQVSPSPTSSSSSSSMTDTGINY